MPASPIAMLLVCTLGCATSRTQTLTQVHRPLRETEPLGRVAVLSIVSAEQSRSWHAEQAADIRASLVEWLESNEAVHVVQSQALLPQYGKKQSRADRDALARYACDRVRTSPVDTVCLVHLKDGSGELAINIGFPAQLVTVRGQCDYDLQLLDVRSGRELFGCSGAWSERTDMPRWPSTPSPSHLGERLAAEIQTAMVSAATPGPAGRETILASSPAARRE